MCISFKRVVRIEMCIRDRGWNGSIFSMIENLSNSIMVPIAGVILAIVMTVDLIQMIADKNNLHDAVSYTHLEFVMDCLQKNTTQVRNMKQYLLAVLFNACLLYTSH